MNETNNEPRLEEVGQYEDDSLPYMNFECPSCEFTLCEWTQCPECGWYDGRAWEATMANYDDCEECGQTIGGGYLCDDCDRVEVDERAA